MPEVVISGTLEASGPMKRPHVSQRGWYVTDGPAPLQSARSGMGSQTGTIPGCKSHRVAYFQGTDILILTFDQKNIRKKSL